MIQQCVPYRGIGKTIRVLLGVLSGLFSGLFLGICFFCLGLAWEGVQPTYARSFRTNQVPHGNTLRCVTCHLSQYGGSVNAFGYSVQENLSGNDADWPAVCNLDSDGDGATNGEELGDPECMWREGDPAPGGMPYPPGDPTRFPGQIDMMVIDMAVIDMELDFGVVDMEVDLGPDLNLFDQSLSDWGDEDAFVTSSIEPDLMLEEPTGGIVGGQEGGQVGGMNGGQVGGMNGGQVGGLSGGQVGGLSGGQVGGLSGGQVGGMSGGQVGGLSGGQVGGLSGGQGGELSGGQVEDMDMEEEQKSDPPSYVFDPGCQSTSSSASPFSLFFLLALWGVLYHKKRSMFSVR